MAFVALFPWLVCELFFTCALVVARGQTSPRGKMLFGREHFHVNPYLGKKFLDRRVLHARHFTELFYTSLQGLHPPVYLLVEDFYLVLDVPDTLADCPNHELVMFSEVPFNGLGDFLLRVLKSRMRT